ncbi:MAG: response regulator [bacterium]
MGENAKRVLIVDDDPDFVLSTRAVLAGAGYEVGSCPTARDALKTAREFKPDLMILDVMMETGSAGFKVSYEVRSDPEFARMPILMVTAVHSTTNVRFSPETDKEFLPVDRLREKPVPADELLREVAALLESRS